MTWRDHLRSWLPTREGLEASRWLSWLAPWLGHPKLWHWSRRGVALGVALGIFFGLLTPLAQIPVTAAAAIVLRANLPAAAASTLITNPVTFGPIYYGAYRLGSWVTGEDKPPAGAPNSQALPAADKTLWQRIAALGKPLLVGLSIISVVAGMVSYLLIDVGWRFSIALRRRISSRKARRSQAARAALDHGAQPSSDKRRGVPDKP